MKKKVKIQENTIVYKTQIKSIPLCFVLYNKFSMKSKCSFGHRTSILKHRLNKWCHLNRRYSWLRSCGNYCRWYCNRCLDHSWERHRKCCRRHCTRQCWHIHSMQFQRRAPGIGCSSQGRSGRCCRLLGNKYLGHSWGLRHRWMHLGWRRRRLRSLYSSRCCRCCLGSRLNSWWGMCHNSNCYRHRNLSCRWGLHKGCCRWGFLGLGRRNRPLRSRQSWGNKPCSRQDSLGRLHWHLGSKCLRNRWFGDV